jgi:hypothetical protein
MKTIIKISLVAIALGSMLIADVLLLLPEADAIYGTRRRAHRRGVVVGYSAGAASGSSASSQQQATSSQQQATTTQQQQAPAQQPAPAAPAPAAQPAAAGGALPLGTTVSTLPGGCVATPIGGTEYQKCGANYYRAAFQGNNLVYVTVQPPQ